jgi:shikimate dehydrogenase
MKLAVLGSPIAHSKSPALHRAAYDVLGLEWSYEAIDVTADALPGFISSLGPDWRGLSLTMPLKRTVLPLLTAMDRFTELTGAANTVLIDRVDRRGFNTDVIGIVDSFRAAGVESIDSAVILGGGATAASALVAVSRLGATRITAAVRSPERLGALVALAEELDVAFSVQPLGALDSGLRPDAVISTLPNGTSVELEPIAGAVLFDVAYEPWPSTLAASWIAAGNTVIPGIEMLVRQALAQVRIFTGGSAGAGLAGEPAVIAAMRVAVGLGA